MKQQSTTRRAVEAIVAILIIIIGIAAVSGCASAPPPAAAPQQQSPPEPKIQEYELDPSKFTTMQDLRDFLSIWRPLIRVREGDQKQEADKKLIERLLKEKKP